MGMASFDLTTYRHLPESALLSLYSSSMASEISSSGQTIASVGTGDLTVSYVINNALNNSQQGSAAAYALARLDPVKYSQFVYLITRKRKWVI